MDKKSFDAMAEQQAREIKNLKTVKRDTIANAIKHIEELQEFLASDLWHSFNEEFKREEDLWEYLSGHFKLCKDKIGEWLKN